MPNVIRMKIGGIEYSITSDEDAAYIKGLGSELEQKLNRIKQKSPFLSATMTAVISALESLDECRKAEAENEKLRLEIKKLLEESACARLDADIYKRQLEELSCKYEAEEKEQACKKEESVKDKTEKTEESNKDSDNEKIAENLSLFDDLPF